MGITAGGDREAFIQSRVGSYDTHAHLSLVEGGVRHPCTFPSPLAGSATAAVLSRDEHVQLSREDLEAFLFDKEVGCDTE